MLIIYNMKRNSNKKMDLNSLLRNRNVLYVVLFLAVANLFSYLMLKQLDAVAFFVIIGFLTTYFSKNMIIILLTSVISTFLLVQIKMLGNNVREGMEGGEEKTEEQKKAEEQKKTEEQKKAEEEKKKEETKPTDTTMTEPTTTEPMTTKKKTSEKFQPLRPAKYNADEDDSDRHKPQVDYAGTLEAAYDNLDKLLSSDAIRNMSEETNRLAEKQQKLMGNIKQISPIMDKASSMLSKLDIGNLSGMMKGMQERLAGFNLGDKKEAVVEGYGKKAPAAATATKRK